MLVNADAAPPVKTPSKPHTVPISKKPGVVLVLTEYMQLTPVPTLPPMKKGGDTNNPELGFMKHMKMFRRTDTHFDGVF